MRRWLSVLVAAAVVFTAAPAEAATTYTMSRTSYVAVSDLDADRTFHMDRVKLIIQTTGGKVDLIRQEIRGPKGEALNCDGIRRVRVDPTSVGGFNAAPYWLPCRPRGMGRTIFIGKVSRDKTYGANLIWDMRRGGDLTGRFYDGDPVTGR